MQARHISARQTSGHSHASHCQRIQEQKARAEKVFTAPPCSAAPACLTRFVAIATGKADGHRQRLRTRKIVKSSDKSEFCKISCKRNLEPRRQKCKPPPFYKSGSASVFITTHSTSPHLHVHSLDLYLILNTSGVCDQLGALRSGW